MAEDHVHGHDCSCGHDHGEEEMDNFVVLTDEEGNEVEFEFLDSVEYGDATYVILLPTDDNGVLIMELEETLIKWIFSTSQAKRKSLLLWRIC